MKRGRLRGMYRGMMALVVLLSSLGAVVSAQGSGPATPAPVTPYFSAQTVVLDDGRVIDQTVINGPPTPPPGYERPTVDLSALKNTQGVATLEVPAYNWSFGCSATSAAMIAAYYDRGSYPNMYTGPTDGGVMPMDNSIWPDWVDSYGDTRHQCPLSATHQGLDGRATRGHVDDYWLGIDNPGPDPYEGNWPEHTLADCTGDFMKTNRADSGNVDGATQFFTWPSGAPTYAADLVAGGVSDIDGGYGIKLFYESRDYAVTTMYNQLTMGPGGIPALGFTYGQYKAEIDAGRPVMVHLVGETGGHTIVGIGYDDSAANLMYINDTWDYGSHIMVWGGTYAGMQQFAVTIVQLQAPATPPAAPTNLTATAISHHQINLAWSDNSANESGFKIERSPLSPGSWTQIGTVGANVTTYADSSGLLSDTTYYYRVRAWNGAGDSAYSNEAHDTTFAGTQYWVYLPLVMRRWPPIPDTPSLSPIENPGNLASYCVDWNDPAGTDYYQLQEDTEASFSPPTQTYDTSLSTRCFNGQAAGTYYYRVHACNEYGCSGWSSVQSTTVSGEGGQIVNGDFEDGPVAWTQFSTHGWPLILDSGFPGTVTPHSGSWAAWLGGDYDEISYIEQPVTIPATLPYLHYWHWIASSDACGFDYAYVRVNGTTVDTYTLCSATETPGWVEHVVNLGAYGGQSVALQIRAETNSSINSNLFIDDVLLAATASAGAAAPPVTGFPLDGSESDTK